MNPHEILEITPGASAEEIKAAYHRLAKKWHPDRYTGPEKVEAEQRFRTLAEAFNALKDSSRTETAPKPVVPPAMAPISLDTADPAPQRERSAEEWYADAKVAFEKKDYDRAMGLANFCLRMNGEKADYFILVAKSLDASGSKDKKALVKAYENVIRLDPKNADAVIRLAELFQGLGMHARATRLWERARMLAPDHKIFRADAAKKAKGSLGMAGQFSDLMEQGKALVHRLLNRG
jgi:tetratricopeptide (TPR) repeat protein